MAIIGTVPDRLKPVANIDAAAVTNNSINAVLEIRANGDIAAQAFATVGGKVLMGSIAYIIAGDAQQDA